MLVEYGRIPLLRVGAADGSGPWVLAGLGWYGVYWFRWCVPPFWDGGRDFLAPCSEPEAALEEIEAAIAGAGRGE